MLELPALTTGQFRALKIAAAHTSRTPRAERVENDPHGRQYVEELKALGMLEPMSWTNAGARRTEWTLEITTLAVLLLAAEWRGDWHVSAGNRV